jgi:hypothetical protein
MIFSEEYKPILKRINSNSVRAQQSSYNNPVNEIVYLSEVIKYSVVFAELLEIEGDKAHAYEYLDSAIKCNIRIISLMRTMKQEVKPK